MYRRANPCHLRVSELSESTVSVKRRPANDFCKIPCYGSWGDVPEPVRVLTCRETARKLGLMDAT